MSTQSEALLSLVTAYAELPEHERFVRESELYGNPVLCTPRVYDEAVADADAEEVAALIGCVDAGLVVVDENPEARRAELASVRPGYQNRATRRAVKGAKRK